MTQKFLGGLLTGAFLLVFCLPASAVPIVVVGTSSPESSGLFSYSFSTEKLNISLTNTSSDTGSVITGFGFSITDGTPTGQFSVEGTLNDNGWSFATSAPGNSKGSGRDAYAITWKNFNGGSPDSGIVASTTGLFGFNGTFGLDLLLTDVVVRFQGGKTSDFAVPCLDCSPPPVAVPEPTTIGLFGAGLLVLALGTRRRPLQGVRVARA